MGGEKKKGVSCGPRGGQLTARGGECELVNGVRVPLTDRQAIARGNIPDARRSVVRPKVIIVRDAVGESGVGDRDELKVG